MLPPLLYVLVGLSIGPVDERPKVAAIKGTESKALADLAAKGGEAATKIKALLDPPPAADGSSRFVPLPEVVPRSARDEPAEVAAIRVVAAKDLFEVATAALKAEPPALALADTCLRDVLAREPDHPEARRLLGYVPHEGGWATPFAAKKLKEGQALHPTYGWVESAWIPHLDRGELPAPHVAGRPTQWLPAAEADELRREFARGWQINTEHFAIRTNVPLAEVIAFGRHLEAMHDVFFSLFADLIGNDHPLVALSHPAKNPAAPPRKPHRVFYFAEKEEYVQFLLPVQGEGVRESLGTYLTAKESKRLGLPGGTSFFFRDPGGQLDATDTLYHEVSHQLLFESTAANGYDEKKGNFWVFEGLGTYFETLRTQPDASLRIGGLVGKRIEVARDRLVKNHELIPIGRLATYNKYMFNGANGNDIYLNYAEAMALAVYLMQAHEGRYRDAFIAYARDVLKGRIRPGVGKSLEDRFGSKLGEIDRDLLAYLKAGVIGP